MIIVCDDGQSAILIRGLPARWLVQIDDLAYSAELFREIAALKDGEKITITKSDKGLELNKEPPKGD